MKVYKVIDTNIDITVIEAASKDEAQERAQAYIEACEETRRTNPEDAAHVTMFDLRLEVEDTTDYKTIRSYADACKVLGVEPMDEEAMTAAGFRPDEIARRKLETITAAVNGGWKPDFNDADEYKYSPWFYIRPNRHGAYAGLACATTNSAASYSDANIGSRLCCPDSDRATYLGDTFADLYAQILVEKL